MNYIFVNSSTNIEYRVDLICEFLMRQGHTVTVFASDYVHTKKIKRTAAEVPEHYSLVDTHPYKKNISFGRLYSHYKFSRDAFSEIKDLSADVLYLIIPQNSNALIGKWYKKRHPQTRVVMDIVDMWPESLPAKGTGCFPFTLWAGIRNKNLKYADIVITECRYYCEKLQSFLKNKKTAVIPWLKRYRPWNSIFENEDLSLSNTAEGRSVIRLCYLGAINNIIDISQISQLIRGLREHCQVELHVIGLGEQKERFLKESETSGAQVFDYGPIYDENEKQRIMDFCDFGLNIMRDIVCVGLSMKSIDYMAAGLPVINNLPGDSHSLVETNKIGVNWPASTEEILEFRADRKKIRRLFETNFSHETLSRYWKLTGC